MEVAQILSPRREVREEGSGAAALAALDAQLVVMPECVDLLIARAQLLNELGRPAEALRASWKALYRDKANPDARFARSVSLCLLHQLEEAGMVLDSLIATHPDYPNAAWLRAGMRRRRFGDTEDVLNAYDLALTAEPSNPALQIERADVLRSLGRYAEARTVYARFQDAALCDDATLRVDAAFKLGCVAMVLEENDTACTAFRTVLEAAPDYPDAQAIYTLLACPEV